MAMQVGNYRAPAHVAMPGRFVLATDRLGALVVGSFDDRREAVDRADTLARITGRTHYVFDRIEGVSGGE